MADCKRCFVFVPFRGLIFINTILVFRCSMVSSVFVPFRGLIFINTTKDDCVKIKSHLVFVPFRGLIFINNERMVDFMTKAELVFVPFRGLIFINPAFYIAVKSRPCSRVCGGKCILTTNSLYSRLLCTAKPYF